ncbi:hypothetical protein C8R47DRAFT_1158683 [Mycena vitilis]|nr:hypothetical protein C8R47DRAFT_1172580 [Mycena vitilis]KAJ6461992.1 hypothetical protein C8R47DRAFT_1158683 [Mycena vitilis]
MLVLSLCNWPQEEARMILREMMRNLMELLHPSASQLESLYNFLAAIIQVKQQWRVLAWEAAHLLRDYFQLQPPVTHPIHTLCSVSPSELNKLPLSTMQITHSATMRSEMWLSLYGCDTSSQARVGDRMSEVERIIGQALHPDFSMQIPTTPQVFDALVDTIIFASEETFGSRLRASAIHCLLDYCRLSKQWDHIYQLFSMFDFQVQMQIFIIFRDQLPMDKLDDLVKSWPAGSTYQSDFFLLLSGWVLGMSSSGRPRRI